MNEFMFELAEMKNLLVEWIMSPKNIGITLIGIAASGFIYLTVNTYLKRKKYEHIPGPPTKGYDMSIFTGPLHHFKIFSLKMY